MLLTLSNELCTSRFKKASHFTNRLAFPIIIDEYVKGGPSHYIQLEGISITPWPTKPTLVTCNLCEAQPCGKGLMNVLSLVYGREKFTRPKVIGRIGRTDEVTIEIKTISDNVSYNLTSATVQLSLIPVESV